MVEGSNKNFQHGVTFVRRIWDLQFEDYNLQQLLSYRQTIANENMAKVSLMVVFIGDY